MLTTMSSQSVSVKRQPKLPDVFWLERRALDVPVDDLWLGERELAKLAELRFVKRRNDWRLGRWTAKCALAAYLNRAHSREALREIEILAGGDGSPEAWVRGQHGTAAISLSHSNGKALCVVGVAKSALGCDLELVEPRSEAFLSDYFTRDEQRQIRLSDRSQRVLLANLFWSAKESALKAMRTGLRQDTRTLSVVLLDDCSQGREWHPLEVQSDAAEVFQGWWKEEEAMLRTIVGRGRSSLPIPLSQ
jgi:4'-phosphopantetheinyl transferase